MQGATCVPSDFAFRTATATGINTSSVGPAFITLAMVSYQPLRCYGDVACALCICCRLLLAPTCCCRCCLHAQGEFVDKLAELVVKTYGGSHSISKGDIYFIQDKRKLPYFDEDSEGDE